MMRKAVLTLLSLAFLLLHLEILGATAGNEDRILAVAQNMEAAFNKLEDYTCEVEQIFYRDGAENQRYLFKFVLRKRKEFGLISSSPTPD